MRICKSKDFRADDYEHLKLWLKADKTKNKKKKDFIAITMANSLLICLIFSSSMFLFFDKLMFKEKKVPTVTTPNALHGVSTSFFPHKSYFAVKIFLTPQPLPWCG